MDVFDVYGFWIFFLLRNPIVRGLNLSALSLVIFFFSSRRRHTRFKCDWSSDVCSSDLGAAKALTTPVADIKPPPSMGPGAFLGMTIVDAAKTLLSSERRQLSNAEILDAFKKGGLILNSADPLNTVGSVLNRRFMQIGDV